MSFIFDNQSCLKHKTIKYKMQHLTCGFDIIYSDHFAA